MTRRLLSVMVFRIAVIGFAVLALSPGVAPAQVVVKVNDVVNFKLGFQLQGWSEWLQDPISEGYQQNFKIRRVRVIMAGNLAKNVSFFFQTDNPNMGQSTGTSTKAINTGFLVQDAFGEWHPFSNDMFVVDFGKMLMPFTRNSLQSTSSHLSLDGGTWTFLQSAPLTGDAGRDVGLQLKSYLVNDHLEFRAGLFDGLRAPANSAGAGSRNPYRFVARAVYNIFDTEKGYVPVGTNLGKKRILAFGAGYDSQGGYESPSTALLPSGDGYKAYGGDIMVDLPVGSGEMKDGKSAFTAHVDYIHYDGGCGVTAVGTRATNCLLPTLVPQEELFTDAGFYFKGLDLQPFVRYETLIFKDAVDHGKNIRRYMGGFNYYVSPSAQNLKITAAFERIVPASQPAVAKTKNTNHVVVQLQFYYF
jgi:hypothetical protein